MMNEITSPKFLTVLGNDGSGRGVNSSPESAFMYTHDIFVRAALEGLDVYMLTGSLREGLRDSLYKRFTGRSFADSIRDVLSVGRNVSIFIWDDVTDTPHSADCLKLMREVSQHPEWGVLDIRSSGTRENSERINHFIIAKNPDGSRWIVRVEKPHPPMTEEQILHGDFRVPAALYFDTSEAREIGEPLLNAFHELSDAVPV